MIRRLLLRRAWLRIAASLAAFVLLTAIVFHGLIPFFFYEANSRGYEKPGEWTTRLFAATYFPVNGNTYLTEKLLQAELGAGAAGRACAASDAHGCDTFEIFTSLYWLELGPGLAVSCKSCQPVCYAAQWRQCSDLGPLLSRCPSIRRLRLLR